MSFSKTKMKRSIIVAFLILAGVVGWLMSGQITNVNAQDETKNNSEEASKFFASWSKISACCENLTP